MKSVVVFLLALPVSVELWGALFGVLDGWRVAASRAAALERFAVPLLLWGALWWLLGVGAWRLMVIALVLILACQVVTFYGMRLLIRIPRLQTIAIDTDQLFFFASASAAAAMFLAPSSVSIEVARSCALAGELTSTRSTAARR